MGNDSTEANACARFHRRSRGFILAIIATLAGIAGVLLHFLGPPPHEISNKLQPSIAQICAGAGAGCIWAAILLNFLWGLTSQGRYFVTFFTAMLVALPIVFALPPRFGIAAAIVVALGGLALFLYEFGLSIEISSRGIRRLRRFPLKASREIPWDRVESACTDLRKITFYGAGGRLVESENRVIFAGNGTNIALNTTRYDAVIEDLHVQIKRAQPFAIAATLRRIKSDGSARLGPVELRRDALYIKRFSSRRRRDIPPFVHILAGLLTFGLWIIGYAMIAVVRIAKRPVRVPLDKIANATFEKGSLVIVAGRKMYLPLRRVPNGIYFPELLAALRKATPFPGLGE
ncbi:MAG: hypothetical protein NTU60_09750 [Candidatus Aminicenantes bacterium]|nr:hypothetical protein [Candidatus Aminicenantes bacterium]